ncbi:BTB/POZ protein [Rhizophagus irregularis DAOM 181602=DAOM 197198]|nr:BTB/POZ protein [Rhizophagus irregularis DAOM 181602=DAOM 197198]
MIILRIRSPFLRRALTSEKKNDSNNLTHIKLPNISPETFQIILKYLYGGIFSLHDKDNFKDPFLSRVKNMNKAFYYCNNHGPSFGDTDLRLKYSWLSESTIPFNENICKQVDYEKSIRDTEDNFYVEDYEVFQIKRK